MSIPVLTDTEDRRGGGVSVLRAVLRDWSIWSQAGVAGEDLFSESPLLKLKHPEVSCSCGWRWWRDSVLQFDEGAEPHFSANGCPSLQAAHGRAVRKACPDTKTLKKYYRIHVLIFSWTCAFQCIFGPTTQLGSPKPEKPEIFATEIKVTQDGGYPWVNQKVMVQPSPEADHTTHGSTQVGLDLLSPSQPPSTAACWQAEVPGLQAHTHTHIPPSQARGLLLWARPGGSSPFLAWERQSTSPFLCPLSQN